MLEFDGWVIRLSLFRKDIQSATKKCLATGVTLNLPAGGFRNSTGIDDYNSVRVNLVFARNRLIDVFNHSVAVELLALVYLMDYYEPLFASDVDGESRTTAGPQRRVTSLHSEFDILWVVVEPTNNDQVFQTAGHKQLASE